MPRTICIHTHFYVLNLLEIRMSLTVELIIHFINYYLFCIPKMSRCNYVKLTKGRILFENLKKNPLLIIFLL